MGEVEYLSVFRRVGWDRLKGLCREFCVLCCILWGEKFYLEGVIVLCKFREGVFGCIILFRRFVCVVICVVCFLVGTWELSWVFF